MNITNSIISFKDSSEFNSIKLSITKSCLEKTRLRDRTVSRDGFWFYPVLDFSPAFQRYQFLAIQKFPITIGVQENAAEIYNYDGWFFVSKEIIENGMMINRRIREDASFSKGIISLEHRVREAIANDLLSATDRKITENELFRLFQGTTTYESLILDQLVSPDYPLKVLDETKPDLSYEEKAKFASTILYPNNEVPYQNLIQIELINLALNTSKYGFSENRAKTFFKEVGFLERTDMKPSYLENVVFLKNWVKRYLKQNNEVEDLLRNRREILYADIRSKQASQDAYRMIIGLCDQGKGKLNESKNLIDILVQSLDYNERCRKLRTKFFVVLEKWFIEQGKDPMNSELPECFYENPTKENTEFIYI